MSPRSVRRGWRGGALALVLVLSVCPSALAAPDLTALSAGDASTCAILNDSSLKCWGLNDEGQLGRNTGYDGANSNVGDQDGEMGDALTPIDLGNGHTAVSVSSMKDFVCAILDNGDVKCWGKNEWAMLGIGSAVTNIGLNSNEMGDNLAKVELGTDRTATSLCNGKAWYHMCAVLDDGSVKCWGSNWNGGLGTVAKPASDSDDYMRGEDASDMGDNLPAIDFGGGHTAKQVACGERHTCAILDDNSIKCFGTGKHGQLGIGNISTFTNEVGSDYMVGDEIHETPDKLPTVDLGSGRTAKYVAAGRFQTCAILDNDKVKCWGGNDYGELGLEIANSTVGELDSEKPALLGYVDLGTDRTAKQISCGDYHTCAILDDDSLKCWGRNNYGQLGVGDTSTRGIAAGEMGNNLDAVNLGPERFAKYVSAGDEHTCVVLDDYTVKCWGRNTAGQLGLDDVLARGGEANDMGANLAAVDLGTNKLSFLAFVDSISSTPSGPSSTPSGPSSTPSAPPASPPSANDTGTLDDVESSATRGCFRAAAALLATANFLL